MSTFRQYLLKESYVALVVNSQTRAMLQDKFPPKYKDFIGHHITIKFGVPADTTLPSQQYDTTVVGYADDGKGIEALVVSVNGDTRRPDGRTYHITWSIDCSSGYKPVDSNKLIKNGYKEVTPIQITTQLELLK
jgi:hypothetical protein